MLEHLLAPVHRTRDSTYMSRNRRSARAERHSRHEHDIARTHADRHQTRREHPPERHMSDRWKTGGRRRPRAARTMSPMAPRDTRTGRQHTSTASRFLTSAGRTAPDTDGHTDTHAHRKGRGCSEHPLLLEPKLARRFCGAVIPGPRAPSGHARVLRKSPLRVIAGGLSGWRWRHELAAVAGHGPP